MKKKDKYIHHPEYGHCVTCKHWNVLMSKEPCTSCITHRRQNSSSHWEPIINRELDEILGLKSND